MLGSASPMYWHLSHRADLPARLIADRHYNRQKIGTPQFVPPGRCLVLINSTQSALWVTSWPFAEYVKHAWAGAWVNSCFRNESPTLSSLLIIDAVAATLAHYGAPPAHGFISFIDTRKTKRKRDPGRCYLKAGWTYAGHRKTRDGCPRCHSGKTPWPCGLTKGGLVAMQCKPENFPAPIPALPNHTEEWMTL